MKKFLLCVLTSLLVLGGCSGEKDSVVDVNDLGCEVLDVTNLSFYDRFVATSFEAGFDTAISLTAYTDKPATFNEYFEVMETEFMRYHKLFDKYNNYEGINNVKTINDNAGIAPVVVDKELMELLVLAREWYDTTEGAFDITLGPVLSIWHDYREEAEELAELGLEGNVPTYDELQEASQFVGWKYVELDEENLTVYINHPNASIDVGGVAKGFTTEKVAQKLECMGLNSGIVNAGGNVRTIGRKPNGEAWSIGIQHPNKSEDTQSVDSVRYKESMSMVTSADYYRYYEVDGVRYHHLISPFTLYPADRFRSTSINIKHSGIADILSTTMYIHDYETGKRIIEAAGGSGVWVTEEENKFEAEHFEILDGLFIAVSGGLEYWL